MLASTTSFAASPRSKVQLEEDVQLALHECARMHPSSRNVAVFISVDARHCLIRLDDVNGRHDACGLELETENSPLCAVGRQTKD